MRAPGALSACTSLIFFSSGEVHRDRGPVLPTLFSLFDVRSEEAALAALTGGNGRVKFKRIATLNQRRRRPRQRRSDLKRSALSQAQRTASQHHGGHHHNGS